MAKCVNCQYSETLTKNNLCLTCAFIINSQNWFEDYGETSREILVKTRQNEKYLYQLWSAAPEIKNKLNTLNYGYPVIIMLPDYRIFVTNSAYFQANVKEDLFPGVSKKPHAYFVRAETLIRHVAPIMMFKSQTLGGRYFLFEGQIADLQFLNRVWIEIPGSIDEDKPYAFMFIRPVSNYQLYEKLNDTYDDWQQSNTLTASEYTLTGAGSAYIPA